MKYRRFNFLYAIVSAMLCVALLSTTIYVGASAGAIYSFGTVNVGGLNVRNNVNGKSFAQLSRNTVVQILQTLTSPQNHVWYAIYVPDQRISGFVLASYITLMSPQASASYATNNSAKIWNGSNNNSITNALGYVKINSSGTNLRDRANGNAITKVDRDLVFAYYAIEKVGGYDWYRIYSQQYGYVYVRADAVTPTNVSGSASVPVQPSVPQVQSIYGTVTTTLDKVNVRQAARVNATRIGRVAIGNTFALKESPTTADGFTWYKIDAGNNVIGYIRGDCARFNNNASNTPPVNPPAVNPPAVNPPIVNNGNTTNEGIGYGIVVTLPAASLRQSPDGRIIGSINANQKIPVSGPPITQGAYTWYPVNVNLVPGYLRNDSVTYTPGTLNPGVVVPNQPPVVPGNPGNPGAPNGTPSKNLITIMDKVNLRVSPSRGSRAAYNVPKGTAFPYSRETYAGGSKWYKIAYNASELWVMAYTVRVLSTSESAGIGNIGGVENGNNISPSPVGYVTTTKGGVNVRQTAGGKTISSIASKGTVLKQFGTSSTRNYTWYKIEFNGVSGFVRGDCVRLSDANGGSLNAGNSNPNSSTQDIGGFQLVKPVRKSDWNTGEMNRLWPRGSTFAVYDIKTGKTFRARRWAGGKHIDAEPLTKDDTSVICSMYGVSSAKQINSRQHWQGRPLWVTINGVTYCASMYGVPHNMAGNTIKNNNFDGQFCIHFTNSTGHTTGAKPSENHRRAIEEAFVKGQ